MEDSVMIEIGARLERARLKLGVSKYEICKRAGFKAISNISNYEVGKYKGTSMTFAKIIWLSEFYEISADELFKDLEIDEYVLSKAREKYDFYIENMMRIRKTNEEKSIKKLELQLVANNKRRPKKEKHDFAIRIQKFGQTMWFVKSKMLKHDYTNETTRVCVFERDIDKATTFETIADARRFVTVNGMQIVRWRDYCETERT